VIGQDVVLSDDLDSVDARLSELRRDVSDLRDRASESRDRGGQLVMLDLGRALVALGGVDIAIARARRHAGLEETG
jgi:hypothetical protein